jgi:hypothetical protein
MLYDIEQIKQLKARYFRFLDTRNWDEFRTLFTDDCRHLGYEGEGSVIDTWEGYRAMLHGGVLPGRSVHHGHMPEITLETPTEARGVWAMFDFVERTGDEPRSIIGYGHYHETYRKQADGWKISSKRLVRLRVDDVAALFPLASGG